MFIYLYYVPDADQPRLRQENARPGQKGRDDPGDDGPGAGERRPDRDHVVRVEVGGDLRFDGGMSLTYE